LELQSVGVDGFTYLRACFLILGMAEDAYSCLPKMLAS
jgi:hypothetical protein